MMFGQQRSYSMSHVNIAFILLEYNADKLHSFCALRLHGGDLRLDNMVPPLQSSDWKVAVSFIAARLVIGG